MYVYIGKENSLILMDRYETIKQMVKSSGLVRPRDVEARGIPREYLLNLFRKGELVRVGRGLYALPDSQTSEFSTLAEVATRVPNGVVCLLSALQFHNLTTQLPHEVWLAIEGTSWGPRIDYPPLRIMRYSGKPFTFGVEVNEVNNVPVKVYSVAKTVADCFRFRNKIGLDVALEALQETWREKRATIDEIWEAAKVCRVTKVMRPYMETIVL